MKKRDWIEIPHVHAELQYNKSSRRRMIKSKKTQEIVIYRHMLQPIRDKTLDSFHQIYDIAVIYCIIVIYHLPTFVCGLKNATDFSIILVSQRLECFFFWSYSNRVLIFQKIISIFTKLFWTMDETAVRCQHHTNPSSLIP